MLPDLTVMGKIIGGGLPAAAFGGSAALMERIAPGRRRLPGRHAEREPARGRRRPGDARAARRAGLPRPQRHHPRAGRRPARGGRRPPGLRHLDDRPGDRLLRRRAADGLRGRRRLRPRGLRRLVPRAAGPRRLPARLAVRGLVPVHRAHRASTSRARSRRPRRRSPRSRERARAPRRRRCATRAACSPRTVVSRRRRARSRTATRSPSRGDAYPLLVEAIREGYLQHYAAGPRRAARRPGSGAAGR